MDINSLYNGGFDELVKVLDHKKKIDLEDLKNIKCKSLRETLKLKVINDYDSKIRQLKYSVF